MKLHVLLRGAATHTARKQVSLPSSPPTGSVGTLFLIAVSPVSSTEWKLRTQQMLCVQPCIGVMLLNHGPYHSSFKLKPPHHLKE